MIHGSHDEHFEQLAAGYFDDVLDDAGRAELKALLHADDRRVKRFAQLAQLDQMITSEIAYQHEAKRFGLSRSTNDSASTYALAELASLYEDGLQDPMNFATWREEKANKAAAKQRKIWLTRALMSGAVAAAVLFAVVLLAVVFTGDSTETPLAEQQINQSDTTDITNPVTPVISTLSVATLTATHNARWAEGASATGSALHPGHRLTLTAGFAEITTNDGAIAILQAPATIELLNHNNAIRLHTGKLVGICETESSRGFLVRTAEMDVVDLGTRFAVDASQADQVEVHVFTGEVDIQQADRPGGGNPWSQRLVSGQAARKDASMPMPTLIACEMDRFTFNDDFLRELPGTGFGIKPGQPDPNWQIVAYQGQPLDQLWVPSAIDLAYGADNLPNHPQRSQWLNWHRTQRNDDLSERYVFQTSVSLPESIDPATARLVIDCSTDNQLAAIHVNGERQADHASQPDNGFEPERIEVSHGLVPGENTIGFEIINLWPEEADENFKNGVGLRVVWRLHGQTR